MKNKPAKKSNIPAKKPRWQWKFPKINRKIPEWQMVAVLVVIVLLLLTVAYALEYLQLKRQEREILLERETAQKQVVFWEKVAQKYPDYRDAYFQLALLEYQLQNNQKATEYLQKTLSIDPNFEKGKKLQKIMGE